MRRGPGRVGAVSVIAAAMIAAIVAPAAANAAGPAGQRFLFGVLVHDRGPTADNNEDGIDPNLEMQFRPPDWALWRTLGNPRPHLGLTPNLNRETSAAYGGLTFELDLAGPLFATIAVGLAIHDGPLHKDEGGRCGTDSDCGFGSRVLPRGALELGVRLGDGRAVSLVYSHMSHGGLLADENEGVDHVGVRYGVEF